MTCLLVLPPILGMVFDINKMYILLEASFLAYICEYYFDGQGHFVAS
jgi:hypothetical protein